MSSDDEDLKLAIALSLAETSVRHSSSKDDPIVISSDEDEPVPVTNTNSQPRPVSQLGSTVDATPSTATSTAAATTATTFLSERAQLEAARLARLKRLHESSALPSKPQPKSRSNSFLDDPFVSSDENENRGPLAKKAKLSATAALDSHIDAASSSGSVKYLKPMQPMASGSHVEKAAESELFWSGELRQTANMHVERERDTGPVFRLHDVLGNKSEFSFIILSSFVTQLSWIYGLLPPDVPVLLFAQPDETGSASVHNVLPNWVKVTPELKGGRGCMHIKLMLLFYKSGRMRVVISTANLVDYDWRDIENSVWLQDIPPRSHIILRDPKADDFPAQLEGVLDALGAQEGLRALRQDHAKIPLRSVTDIRCGWDFSKVRAQLVPSLAGRHEGWPAVLRVGHLRLMRVVRLIGARADPLQPAAMKWKGSSVKGNHKGARTGEREFGIECQGSSIGSYTPAWIDEILGSARGASPEVWLDDVRKTRVKNLDNKLARDGWAPWGHLKILFPSLQTVRASRLGEDGAGTMFCQRRQWNSPKFPRQLFYDSNSKRGPVLMHSKMILVTFKDASTESMQSGTSSINNRTSPPPDPDSSATEPSSDSESEVQEIDPERDASIVGWLYVGSHNFTPSAWGTLRGSSITPVMNITNFELGVVLPLKDIKQADELTCWNRPPRKYAKKDMPWIQNNF